MAKALSLNELRKKTFKVFDFEGIWRQIFGTPERFGFWLVYGAEKHGKTWFCLLLAEYLSRFGKVLYVSAEEGTSKAFVEATERAKLQSKNLQFIEYLPIEELEEKINKKRAPKVIFIDNITAYADELKNGKVRKMMRAHKNKLIVFVAHEDKGEPYTATAKLVKRFATIITRVEGLACFVSGRCPGGQMTINEEKATLYHGTEIKQ